MGVCYSTPTITAKPIFSSSSIFQYQSSDSNDNSNIKSSSLFPQKNQIFSLEPPFTDMPEWPNHYTKGYGIKEMPGYKCTLKINELALLRENFWSSKTENKQIWKLLHQACVYDHTKAEEFLYKNSIRTLNGCINQCVDPFNNIYCIPNFCINDPYFRLELLPEDQTHNQEIEIHLLDICNGKIAKIKVNESAKGGEIIEKYSKMHNIDLTINKVRLLFGGGIISENESLYQHKVKHGYSIQICVSPIE